MRRRPAGTRALTRKPRNVKPGDLIRDPHGQWRAVERVDPHPEIHDTRIVYDNGTSEWWSWDDDVPIRRPTTGPAARTDRFR